MFPGNFIWDLLIFSDDEYGDVDWDNLGFGLVPTDYMYIMKCAKEGSFEQGQLSCYGNIELSPSAAVLNYGQVKYHLFFHFYIEKVELHIKVIRFQTGLVNY